MLFEKNEIRDIVISVLVLAFVFSGLNIYLLPIMIIVIIVVFLLHEFGHKFSAQYFGCYAVYKMWPMGLLLGVFSGLLGGIIFAAPGAVYIYPYNKNKFAFNVANLTRREYGIISLAGPGVNIITGYVFTLLSYLFNYNVLFIIARIAFFLAIFNLIPIPPLDGYKVLAWDKKYWILSLIAAIIGYIIFGLLV
ncbi:MAG: site-2 protease family protein [Candidatus Aenigmarchaeota archaeon]|nr:site-2 protease family protein [Candidatus Aenigmarchaeota archaeon]